MRLIGILGAVLLLIQPAIAQNWQGPVMGGHWGNSANWTGGLVPNNIYPDGPFFSPVIDGAAVEVNDSTTYIIDNLTLQNAAHAILTNGQLTLGFNGASSTVSNAGTITITPNAGNLAFNIGSGQVVLSGAGVMNLTGAGVARVLGSGTLVNQSAHSIQGEGTVAEGALFLDNSGRITATGGTLALTPEGMNNTGTLVALSGATLNLSAGFGAINNIGGDLFADGGRIRIFNGQLTGGTLSTTTPGLISLSNNAVLQDVTNLGRLVVETAHTAELRGVIVNSGIIEIAETAGGTLRIGDAVNLSGSGEILLRTNVSTLAGSGTLTNVNNLIHGQGAVGNNTLAIVNQMFGVINADINNATLTIDAGTGNMSNAGTMTASLGGSMFISGNGVGTYTNTGTISAQNISRIVLGGPTIIGGRYATSGSGSITVSPNATLQNFENFGNFVIGASSQLIIGGINTNSGSINLSVSGANLSVPLGGTELNGSGTVNIVNGATINGNGTLTSQNLIHGAGSIGSNQMALINEGIIRANVNGGTLTIDPGAGGFLNSGIAEAVNSAALVLTGNGTGLFGNTLLIQAQDMSQVRLVTNPTIQGGTFQSFGTGTFAVSAGAILDGIHNAAPITIESGVCQLMSTVTSPGAFIINSIGTLTTTSGGTFNLALVLANGRFAVNGGTSNVSSIVGVGTTLVQSGSLTAGHVRSNALILTGGAASIATNGTPTGVSLVGTFSMAGASRLDLTNNDLIINYSGGSPQTTIRGLLASGSLTSSTAAASTTPKFALGYAEASAVGSTSFNGQNFDLTSLMIVYTLAGDADLNGKVNTLDFNRLAGGFGTANPFWFIGDFNYSGTVDSTDFAILLSNYGATTNLATAAELGALVPEPVAAAAIVPALLLRRRLRWASRTWECVAPRFYRQAV